MGARKEKRNGKCNLKILYWKEEIVRLIRSCFAGRASACASLTVEFALVLPIFLLGVAALCFRLEIDTIDRGVRSALLSTGKIMAQDALVNEELSCEAGKIHLIQTMKNQGTRTEFIEGGPGGVWLNNSIIDSDRGIIDLVGTYYIRIPGIRDIPIRRQTKVRVKIWCGYIPEEFLDYRRLLFCRTLDKESIDGRCI